MPQVFLLTKPEHNKIDAVLTKLNIKSRKYKIDFNYNHTGYILTVKEKDQTHTIHNSTIYEIYETLKGDQVNDKTKSKKA